MTQAYGELQETISLVRRAWRARRMLEGALAVAAAACAALAAAVVVDLAFDPGIGGRVFLLLMVLAATAYAAWRWWIREVAQRHGDDYFAALVESRNPTLGNRLINALQLGRAADDRSQRVIDRIVADGVKALDDVDPTGSVASPRLKQSSLAAGGAVVLLIAVLLVLGPGARTSLARVLLPWSSTPPFTWTQVTIDPDEPVRVLEGEAVTIDARVGGRPVEQVILEVRDAAGERRAHAMRAIDDATFRHRFPAVDRSFTFAAIAGDGRSESGQIIVDARPRIVERSATITPPPYTGREAKPIFDFDGHAQVLPTSRLDVTFTANKDLDQLELLFDSGRVISAESRDPRTWHASFTVTESMSYRIRMFDAQGYEVTTAAAYSVTLRHDLPPRVSITAPGKDLQLRPEASLTFETVARDDVGLASVKLLGQRDRAGEPFVIAAWPAGDASDQTPRRDATLRHTARVGELGLEPGSLLEYWAAAVDTNTVTGPGQTTTRKYTLIVLTPSQSQQLLDEQLTDYAKVVEQLLAWQRRNRAETEAMQPAAPLIERQSLILERTARLADLMRRTAFPAETIITSLDTLAADLMPPAVTQLEAYRDAPTEELRDAASATAITTQDRIITQLEALLERLDRSARVRKRLKQLERDDPEAHQKVLDAVEKISEKLDEFAVELNDLEERYEKMPKRPDQDELTGEQAEAMEDVEHRLDRWKKWAAGAIDEITKLPEGFVADSELTDALPAIFEEIEKQATPKTREIATPMEEGVKWTDTEVKEDLEMWSPSHGDDIKWVMEEPEEGRFEVPPLTLPESLQDQVGDLIEDVEDFDEDADDVTSSWGGNMPQAGWGIMDGPISVFSAQGKTGNQMPNTSEISGRSGGGRRGKSHGQSVGAEASSMEGRPTPARVTNEPYEKGSLQAGKQLDPRGSTGGGKKTGGGKQGLQGGTPPDMVKDMARLEEKYAELREKSLRLARQFESSGRRSSRMNHAIELFESSREDLREGRYQDAARKRKMALGELRATQSDIDESISVLLQKARRLPSDLRDQVSSGVQQPLPEGYEEMVGEYYKAISEAGVVAPTERE